MRSVKTQVDLRKGAIARGACESYTSPFGGLCKSAPAGTSDHGFGGAVDISFLVHKPLSKKTFNSIYYKWLKENAADYGFHNPPGLANPDKKSAEAWHWEPITPVIQK